MSLYNTYRPTDLSEVWGNEETIKALEKILSREDRALLPHAILLHGPSGCGKTTLARIIANRLGCAEDDYREVDSADFRGIDSIRDIRKQMRLRPMAGPCRVWLLDECHKLSADAQNALLKALEDTPEHVFFILATTDPQMLINTVVNRCSKFVVESLSISDIKALVEGIAETEGKPLPDGMSSKIANHAKGSPRAALVALDTVIDLGPDEMGQAIASFEHKESQTIELCRALNDRKSWKIIGKILAGLDDDPEGVRRAVLGYFNKVLIGNGDQHSAWIIECFLEPFYNTGAAGLSYACYRVLNP